VLSAPDKTTLALTGLLLAATLASGCTRSRATTRTPFSDVTDAQRNEATMAVEPGEGAAAVDTGAAVAQTDAKAQPGDAAIDAAVQPTPPNGNAPDTLPPSRQPVVVPPTETIRAETPGAAGPATTAVANGGPARYQIVATVPAIVRTTRPVNGTGIGAGAEIPVEIDEVGLVRQWPVWFTERPSGNIVARPTYWPTDFRQRTQNETRQAFVEPVEFLYNALLLPYRMIRTPPWTKVTYDPATPQDEPRAPYEIGEQQQGQQ
jgi:hypothetical protein